MMPKWILIVLLSSIDISLSKIILDDEIQFDIAWPGQIPSLIGPELDNFNSNEFIEIKTSNNEQFKCKIPSVKQQDEASQAKIETYEPVSNILNGLYSKKICSYRIESYWIYELCHGVHVRQYHETKQGGKRVVPEEYYLGYYDANKQEKEFYVENGIHKTNIQWKIMNGKRLPFFVVKYTDGTLCPIVGNKPREINVFYTCDELSNDSIFSFEETSSCTYEMIVYSKIFCQHSAFKAPEPIKENIECFSFDDKIKKPNELILIEEEKENFKNSKNKLTMTSSDGNVFMVELRTAENEQQDEEEPSAANTNTQTILQDEPKKTSSNIPQAADREIMESFLSGSQCLYGGTGWWKYELCYGKHVKQYHDADANGPRVVINLGKWDKEAHLDWIDMHPNKKLPKKIEERTMISLFYGEGDFCEKVNKDRQVEVRLKCDRTSKSHAISMYLLEPSTCEYILTLESPLLCILVDRANENGLNETEAITKT